MKFPFMAAAFAVSLLIAASPAQAKHKRHHVASVPPSVSCGMDRGVSLCPGIAQAPMGRRPGTVAVNGYDIASEVSYLPHPSGCPRIAFCACAAAVEVFGGNGKDWRSLWPARAWYKFPRTHNPSAGDVAVRNHHVFVLRRHIEGDVYLVADYNSGGHLSRLHEQSIRGYVIVSPSRSHVAQLN